MYRVLGVLTTAALLTAGCAPAAGQSRSGADVMSARHSLPITLRTAPVVGPAVEVAPAPALVPAPRSTPTVSTKRIIQGTPQPAISPATPAAAEQQAPLSQPVNAQCPTKPGSGLPCVKR